MSTPSLFPSSIIVSSPALVDRALHKIGVTREIVRAVAFAAAGARADALAVDPVGTPGTLSYIHGVRTVRLNLLPLGWLPSRDGNLEATINHPLGVQILFQNVDRACGDLDPQAISGKGPASRNLIRYRTLDLFDANDPKMQSGKLPIVWLICVSADDNSIRAEVSCPSAFEGDQFDGFLRRIFVVDESFAPKPTLRRDSYDDDGSLNIDIPVSKK